MKRTFIVLFEIFLSVTIAIGQRTGTVITGSPPLGFSYKATIVKSNGSIVANKVISLKISILQGDDPGPKYWDIFYPRTNEYGQIDIVIGENGGLGSIDWANGPFFLKTEIDDKGGNNFYLMSVTQLLSVPYALYAGSSTNASNVFYNDLIGAPTFASIAFSGNYGDLWGAPILSQVATTGDYNHLLNKPILFSGNYSDLINKPLLFDGKFSSLTDIPSFSDIALSGDYIDLLNKPSLFSGNYLDLANRPTDLSQFNNNVPFLITESDPIFSIHPAYNITDDLIINWNTAYNWGNHTGLYRPINYVPTWNEITNNPFSFINPEIDQILKYNGTSWINFIPNYLTAEVDGDITNELQTLSLVNNVLSISGITNNNITFNNWDTDLTNDVTTDGDQKIAGNKTFIGTLTANLNANNNVISNIANPLSYQDAATKAYVDELRATVEVLTARVAALESSGSAQDADGDGYTAAIDCNDEDVNIHPGATEICGDGIDQDCDGNDLTCNYSSSCLPESEEPILKMIRLINQTRIEHGLTPTAPDPRLAFSAQEQADYCADLQLITHQGEDGSSWGQRIINAGYTIPTGEIAAMGSNDPSSIMNMWLESEMHLNTILANHNHLGIGIAQSILNDIYWIVDFGREEGGPSCIIESQDADQDGVSIAEGDCDDSDPSIKPGAVEICDGKDNDCDGQVDEGCEINSQEILTSFLTCASDNDCEIYDLTCVNEHCSEYLATAITCLNTSCLFSILNDHNSWPWDETWTNDEIAAYLLSVCGSKDEDGDGLSPINGDCDDNNASIHPGADEICDDGIDQNCDGKDQVCNDNDGDGFAAINDCDDTDPTIYPGAPEICEDGIDQDCNRSDLSCDDFDDDGDGFTENAGDCDDANARIYPGSDEICDGRDNDCDGQVDEDLEAPLANKNQGICIGLHKICDGSNGWIEPDYSTVLNYEDIETICDGLDNDCDGLVDEDCPSTFCTNDGDCGPEYYCGEDNICTKKKQNGEACDNGEECLSGICFDGFCISVNQVDQDGDGWTIERGDCDDNDPTNFPGNYELCDGKDNNCNGLADSPGEYDFDQDGFMACQGDCNDNDPNIYPGAPEIPDDGVDNNCDGVIDESQNALKVDLVFLVDQTADMAGVILNLQNSLSNIITYLSTSFSDFHIGLASFQDFPINPYGSDGDVPYRLLVPLTSDFNSVQYWINRLEAAGGGDSPESGIEALYQVATGAGLSSSGGYNIGPSNIGFRPDSRKIIIIITDATFHLASDYNFTTHSLANTLDALIQLNVSVVSIEAGNNEGVRQNLENISVITGAEIPAAADYRCHTGIGGSVNIPYADGLCPLVYDISNDGTDIFDQFARLVDGILTLIDN